MVDYTDVEILEKHLVGLELLPEKMEMYADMSYDGELSVTDLSILIHRVEKTLDYQAELSSVTEKFFYEKGEIAELKFHAEVSHGAAVERVVLDGVEYETEQETGSVYTVRVEAGDTAGIREYGISEILLDSGQSVKTDYREKIEVLRSAPSVEEFQAEELTDSAQMKVTFRLADEDGALTSAVMEVFRGGEDAGDSRVLVQTEELSGGYNEFILDLEEDTAYTLHINAGYDRASGKLETPGDHMGSLSLVKEIQLNLDYRFTFGGLASAAQDGTPTQKFGKNEPILLTFESTNATGFSVERVKINGKEYRAEQTETGYLVTADGFPEAGEKKIAVEEVVLENGKVFTPDSDNVVFVSIQKEMPAITGLAAFEEAEKGEIRVSFRLYDPDSALSGHKIVIRNAEGNTAGELDFGADDLTREGMEGEAGAGAAEYASSGAFDRAVRLTDTGLTSSYTVQILGDCDVSYDGTGLESRKVLAELSIRALPRAIIAGGRSENYYVEKGGKTGIIYEILDNVDAEIRAMIVNNREFAAEDAGNGEWKVTADAPETAGKTEFVLSRIVFADGTEAAVLAQENNPEIEVLKSAPEVSGFVTEDILEKGQVKFQFAIDDADQAFREGKARLVRKSDGIVLEEETIAAAGDQEILFSVAEQTEYDFQVMADWNRSEDGSISISEDRILERPVYVVRDYGLQISDLTTLGEDGTEQIYFEPGSAVRIRFHARTATSLAVESVQVGEAVYNLAEAGENLYEFTVEGGKNAGIKEIVLERVSLENGKELETGKTGSANPGDAGGKPAVRFEVLKEVPEVRNLTWEKTADDRLKIRIELTDRDGAVENARAELAEKDGRVLLTEDISAGENELSAALTVKEDYTVKVTADYDRDSNVLDDQSNAYRDILLYSADLAASRDALELKDVTETELYYSGGAGNRTKIEVLDVTGGLPDDPENYYAVIRMKNLPDFYAGIREFRRENGSRADGSAGRNSNAGADSGRVYAVLDQENMVLYGEDGTRSQEYAFPVAYRDGQGEYPLIKSAEDLFRQMADNPKGKFELSEDLDASGLSDSAAAVAGTFTGELDGNGYRIRNLPTSIFATLSGAHIHDLVIENAQITAQRSGILANVIQNRTVVERVFIIDSTVSNSVDELGTFAGKLLNSTIRESAASDVSVKGLVAVGGLVGRTESGALIENCYVTGKVQGTYDHPSLGARVGGAVGWHGGGTISRCYTQAQIIAPARKGNGGIIGGPNTGSPSIEYTLSMSSGAGYRIAGFDVLDGVKEVYEYSGSESVTSITDNSRDNVKETDRIYESGFYEEVLGFDGDIWDLDLADHGKRPNLKNAPVDENKYNIPDYSALRRKAGYRAEREKIYANMARLMPFSDSQMWIEYGNMISDTDPLAAGTVQYVLPLDENGALVAGIEKSAPGQVKKIRVVFSDEAVKEYGVAYRKFLGGVAAVYGIEGSELPYQFHRFAVETDSEMLREIAERAAGLDYRTDLAALTPEDESRLYADYYSENVSARLQEIIRNLAVSQADYPFYSGSEAVRALAEERIKDEERLKKLLYAYNYYDKWYRIDYSGVDLSSLMFFSGELLAGDMTAANLTDQLFAAPQAQRDTGQTVTFYNNVLKDYTGQEIMDFLEELSERIAGYDDPNEWFRKGFGGVLKEEPSFTDTGKIRYRIWDNLKGLEDRRKNIVLPILTAPQEDMYLVSVPSQIILGSMNRYETYLNKDGNERERMYEIMSVYAEKMGIFYGVSSQWISNAAQQLNSFVNIQYDTRLSFPQSEAADAGMQEKGVTRDPVMKWVYEAVDMLNALNGSAAVADGTNVIWMWDAALGTSDYSFFTFSHETAHNQDGRYFYGGAGRREGTGGEAHADGNIAQEMRDGCMVFNISKINDIGVEMTGNFSYERIDSAKKVHSFYREMFETGYVLDYLAAQAFLSLTPEQQAAVAVKAEHTAAGTASMTTTYRRMTADEIRGMQLTDMADLWDNKISVRTGKTFPEQVGTATDGSYGFESFYSMNWYQSHNDAGSPDTHSFKRLGQEMLGLGGYEEGYMIYISALSENDLDALRKITKDDSITWRSYKLGRYADVEQKLDRIPYFDKDTVIAQFRAAFEADAGNGNADQSVETKRMLYGMIKRVTGDFSDGGIYSSPAAVPVTSAEELIRLAKENPYGYYELHNDIDFTGVKAENGSYIPGRFIGILDGKGYRMTGMSYPLFGDLQYAQVKNLTIFEPSYGASAEAMLAVKSKKVTAGNVKVENADLTLPLIKTKTEGYYEYGDMTVTTGDRRITTAEEFLAIGDSAVSLKKKYILEDNLDFTGIFDGGSGSYAVAGTFAGTLDGNGYTITGLDAGLFEKMNGAEVKNLTIEGSSLVLDQQKGALAGEIKNSAVENVTVRDLVINNNANQVGGLAGVITGSTVKRIAIENISITADNTIGGVAGQFDGNLIEDCFVTGRIEGKIRHQMGARAGGITGWMGGGTIRNCYVKVEIAAPDATGNGGIIGGPANGSVTIENSVSLSTGVNANRIAGWDVLGGSSNVYELESSDSRSSRNAGNETRILSVSDIRAGEKAFYTDDLGWSGEVWDFAGVPAGGTPVLRK